MTGGWLSGHPYCWGMAIVHFLNGRRNGLGPTMDVHRQRRIELGFALDVGRQEKKLWSVAGRCG